MGALLSFERFVQGLIEGSVFRLLRGRIEPVEIAKRLGHAMESQQTISVGRIVVPNRYTVVLNPEDFDSLKPIAGSIRHELQVYLAGFARERGFSLVVPPTVELVADSSAPPKSIRIHAELSEASPEPGPPPTGAPPGPAAPPERTQLMRAVRPQAAEEKRVGAYLIRVDPAGAGWRHRLDEQTRIGRGLDNELILEERTVSRNHAEVRQQGGKYRVIDLNSTNGVWVNGRRVREQLLRAGDRVRFGNVEFVFDPNAE